MKKLKLNKIDLEAYEFQFEYSNPLKNLYDYDRFICYHKHNKNEKLQLIFVEKVALIKTSKDADITSFLRFCLSDLRFHNSFFWPDLYAYKSFIVFSAPLQNHSVIDLYQTSQDFPEQSISYICKELLQAIAFLHKNNIILTISGYGGYVHVDGSVKIDILQVAKSTERVIYPSSESSGGMLFQCPEGLLHHTRLHCIKSDMYVFGITLLLLLEGQPPKVYLDNKYPKYLFVIARQIDFPALTQRAKWSTEMLNILDSTVTFFKKDRLNASELLESPLFDICHSKEEFVKYSLQALCLI